MKLSSEDRKKILKALKALKAAQQNGAKLTDLIGRFEQSLDIAKNAKKKRSDSTAPDWTDSCDNCGASPIVPVTGLCGPCTFGEADTLGGDW